jgi:LemA protein
MRYNQTIQQFPSNIFAGMFGFSAKEYFEIEEADREVPKVSF